MIQIFLFIVLILIVGWLTDRLRFWKNRANELEKENRELVETVIEINHRREEKSGIVKETIRDVKRRFVWKEKFNQYE